MKMIVAVVRDENAPGLNESLNRKGFGATKLASTGGFLKAGNTTFLIVVPDGELEEALATIRAACPPGKSGQATGGLEISGATVFVLRVEQMIKV